MKVFAVIGGYNYNGEDFDTLRLFSNWKDARACLLYTSDAADE